MIRKATIKDVEQIQSLINAFAKQDLMLPRSLHELYATIRDFWVSVYDKKVVGCAALHICWQDLAELKSLAVNRRYQGKDKGSELVNACIDEAKALGIRKIFTLTYIPVFFKQFGFTRIKHADLPHKIWAECINCPKFPNCREIALVKIL